MSNEKSCQLDAKRSVLVLSKDRSELLPARIPCELTVGEALDALAVYAGFDPMPAQVRAVRYALWAAPPQPSGGMPEPDSEGFEALADRLTFGELPENAILTIAPQPRPA